MKVCPHCKKTFSKRAVGLVCPNPKCLKPVAVVGHKRDVVLTQQEYDEGVPKLIKHMEGMISRSYSIYYTYSTMDRRIEAGFYHKIFSLVHELFYSNNWNINESITFIILCINTLFLHKEFKWLKRKIFSASTIISMWKRLVPVVTPIFLKRISAEKSQEVRVVSLQKTQGASFVDVL